VLLRTVIPSVLSEDIAKEEFKKPFEVLKSRLKNN
jgi:hypothetical protein